MIRPCASVPTRQAKSGASSAMSPLCPPMRTGFKYSGRRVWEVPTGWVGPRHPAWAQPWETWAHGFLTSTVDWEQRGPWGTGLAPGAGRVWGGP